MTPEDRSDPQLAQALSHLPIPQEVLAEALAHILIDKPIYTVKVVGSRIEFHLLGGEVKTWQAPAAPQASGDTPDPEEAASTPHGGELPPATPPRRNAATAPTHPPKSAAAARKKATP